MIAKNPLFKVLALLLRDKNDSV